MFNASNLSAFKQSLLDIAIKVGVFAVLVVLNFISGAISNGSLQVPTIFLPILTLIVSQFDSFFVSYAQKENIPVPTA